MTEKDRQLILAIANRLSVIETDLKAHDKSIKNVSEVVGNVARDLALVQTKNNSQKAVDGIFEKLKQQHEVRGIMFDRATDYQIVFEHGDTGNDAIIKALLGTLSDIFRKYHVKAFSMHYGKQ